MNLHKMEHLSLDERRRPQQSNSLPGFATIAATAGQGEPGNYNAASPANALHYGQPPRHGAGHNQNFTPYHQSHGQLITSVESVPSTAFSSPRMMANTNYFDTSSVSSSSRESSVYSGTPTSSTNTVRAGAASSSRSTRAKRGSESQGSGSGSDRKRPSMSSNAGPQSGDEFVRWCDTCDSLSRDCSTPKEHERKSRKTVKEKAARGEMAGVLQEAEDLLENLFDLAELKKQMPGNHKRSGLFYDKQQITESWLLALSIVSRELASVYSPEAFREFRGRASGAIRELVTTAEGQDPVELSLLASGSGEEACQHEARGLRCDTAVICRKLRHARSFKANMDRIQGVDATTNTPTPAAAAATLAVRSTRPASTPRRRNHSNL